MSIKEYAKEMIERDQVFRDIAEQTETLWINDKLLPFEMTDALCQLIVTDEDIEDTERRLHKFAPYIKKCFPETAEDDGLIESPLADIPEMKKALENTEDLLILKAFTKVFAMAGVRLGYALCSNESIVNGIREAGQPWAVSGLAQAAGIAALGEPEYITRLSEMVKRERGFLFEGLTGLGLKVIPGEANYLLFKGPDDLEDRMREEGILIRNCSNYPGLGEGWFRTAVRTREDNEILLEKMKKVL